MNENTSEEVASSPGANGDEAGTSDDHPATDDQATYRVTAVVDDGDAARGLVERLSLAGIDGQDMAVDDPGADPEAPAGQSRQVDRAIDAEVLRRLAVRGAVGALAGLAVSGALVLLVRMFTADAVPPSWLLAGVAAGTVLGLLATPVMAPAWEEANAPGPGVRHVVVEPVGQDSLERVRDLLEKRSRSIQIDEIDPG